MSKIDLAYTRGAERWNGLRLLRFAARALLSALQESRERAARNMIRELPHWTVFVIYKVTLACGVVGFGETMQFYTWGTVSEEAIARVMNATCRSANEAAAAGSQIVVYHPVE